MKYNDDSFSLGGRAHGTNIHRDSNFGYDEGYVITPDGIVGVYSQGDQTRDDYTRLDFAINGRQHIRTVNKRLTRRGLVTVAARFAAEMLEQA